VYVYAASATHGIAFGTNRVVTEESSRRRLERFVQVDLSKMALASTDDFYAKASKASSKYRKTSIPVRLLAQSWLHHYSLCGAQNPKSQTVRLKQFPAANCRPAL
jgi:hypothetical protein